MPSAGVCRDRVLEEVLHNSGQAGRTEVLPRIAEARLDLQPLLQRVPTAGIDRSRDDRFESRPASLSRDRPRL